MASILSSSQLRFTGHRTSTHCRTVCSARQEERGQATRPARDTDRDFLYDSPGLRWPVFGSPPAVKEEVGDRQGNKFQKGGWQQPSQTRKQEQQDYDLYRPSRHKVQDSVTRQLADDAMPDDRWLPKLRKMAGLDTDVPPPEPEPSSPETYFRDMQAWFDYKRRQKATLTAKKEEDEVWNIAKAYLAVAALFLLFANLGR